MQLFISTLAQYIEVIHHELEVSNTRSFIGREKPREGLVQHVIIFCLGRHRLNNVG
jgi:hypothetical protein